MRCLARVTPPGPGRCNPLIVIGRPAPQASGFGTSGLGLDNPRDAVNQLLVSPGDEEKTASGKRCGGAGRRGKPDTAGKAETRKPRKHGQLRGYGRREALTSRRGGVCRKGLAPQVKQRVWGSRDSLAKSLIHGDLLKIPQHSLLAVTASRGRSGSTRRFNLRRREISRLRRITQIRDFTKTASSSPTASPSGWPPPHSTWWPVRTAAGSQSPTPHAVDRCHLAAVRLRGQRHHYVRQVPRTELRAPVPPERRQKRPRVLLVKVPDASLAAG